jgi:hypothetical protein
MLTDEEFALVSAKAKSKSVELAAPKQPADEIERRFRRVEEKDLRITTAANRFAEVPSFLEKEKRDELVELLCNGSDLELQRKGWTRKDLRMAIYGTMPKKDWPAAMQASHERVGMRIRKAKPLRQSLTFNLNQINIPAPRPLGPEDRVVIRDMRK